MKATLSKERSMYPTPTSPPGGSGMVNLNSPTGTTICNEIKQVVVSVISTRKALLVGLPSKIKERTYMKRMPCLPDVCFGCRNNR